MFFVLFVLLSSGISAQELSAGGLAVNQKDLPEYIIITTQNTKLLGGIAISIDYKRSPDKDKLSDLEDLLQERKKMRIRNQTDLLNAMSKLGYSYVDTFVATASTGSSTDKDFSSGGNTYRVNMVFQKKEQYR